MHTLVGICKLHPDATIEAESSMATSGTRVSFLAAESASADTILFASERNEQKLIAF